MDKQEFARRVTQMQGSLYRVAASYLRGESDRLDAVAEAIARAWEKRGTLRDEALFSTWMTRILIRVCVNIQRRQKRMTPVDTLPETPTGEDSCAALREAVDSLPGIQSDVIRCRFLDSKTLQDIGAKYNVSREAARSYQDKAMRELRKPSRSRKRNILRQRRSII